MIYWPVTLWHTIASHSVSTSIRVYTYTYICHMIYIYTHTQLAPNIHTTIASVSDIHSPLSLSLSLSIYDRYVFMYAYVT